MEVQYNLSMIKQRLEILYQLVEQMEQGGGGQGGTDDYTELTNKPQINGFTLTGNKTGSDLGLASAAALEDKADKATTYTKTEVDTALAAKANTATTYTKTETQSYVQGEITGAIMNLDVASKGATDGSKYIGIVGQADGKLTAEAFTPALTIMANVSKPPTTDAVNSAINNAKTAVNSYTDTQVATKASVSQIYGTGTAITSGTDLNDLTTAGLYTCQTITIANTLSNTPITGSAFRLEVKYLNNNTRIRQECYILSDTSMYYARTYTSTGWKPWYAFTGTQVVPPESQQNLTSLQSANLTVEPNDEVDA